MACGTMWHRVASLIISKIEYKFVVSTMWHRVAFHQHVGACCIIVWHYVYDYKKSKNVVVSDFQSIIVFATDATNATRVICGIIDFC